MEGSTEQRKQDPTYQVFRVVSTEGETPRFEQVTDPATPVKSPSRQEAIVTATAELDQEGKEGNFMVIPDREVKVIPRKVQVRTEDVFE